MLVLRRNEAVDSALYAPRTTTVTVQNLETKITGESQLDIWSPKHTLAETLSKITSE